LSENEQFLLRNEQFLLRYEVSRNSMAFKGKNIWILLVSKLCDLALRRTEKYCFYPDFTTKQYIIF